MKIQYRIKKTQEFQTIIDQKKRVTSDLYVLYYVPRKFDYARFGISMSKKLGNAVERNKVKRQLRMLIQESVHFEDYPYDVIIIARIPFTKNTYELNKNNLEKLLKKATIK